MRRSDLRRRIAQEWESRGWEYDPSTGNAILDRIEEAGEIDPAALAFTVPAGFLTKARATRAELEEALREAVGGQVPTNQPEGTSPISFTAGGDIYVLQANNSIFDRSPVNQGGTQINLDGGSAEDLVQAVAALVSSGLRGEWNEQLAAAVSAELEGREDVELAELERAVIEAGKAEEPDEAQVKELIEKIAISGIGTFLSTALSSGLAQLPGLVG